LDFVTVGETMLRLDVDPVASLENLDRLQVYVAGTESNVATALARLGLRAAWISKLPATPLGRLVERTVRMHGVDTSRVVWDAAGRLGLYFSHIAPLPRPQTILYDRQGSSFTRLDEEEVNWSFVRRSRMLHITGVTPALGELPRRVVQRALQEARAASRWASIDLNYRATLWPPDLAREVLTPLISQCDLLICSRRDARVLFGNDGKPEAMARALQGAFGCRRVCVTLGAEGAGALDGDAWVQSPAAPVTIVDPIGRGDAFTAGVLYALLTDQDLAAGVRYGVRLAAWKQAGRGDIVWVNRGDLTAGDEGGVRR